MAAPSLPPAAPRVASVSPPDAPASTFGRNVRLTRGSEFKRVFGTGNRHADGSFVVLAVEAGGREARLGMAIGKKVASRAVQRNRLKRLVRESFRMQRDSLPALDFVVMARHSAPGRTNAELRRSLDRHWRRYAPNRAT